MKTPKRLLQARENDLDVALLESARGDEPPDGLADRTLLALGVAGAGVAAAAVTSTAAAATSATSATAGSAVVGGGAVAGGGVGGGAAVGGSVIGKWIAIAGVVGATSLGGAVILRNAGPPAAPSAAAPSAAITPALTTTKEVDRSPAKTEIAPPRAEEARSAEAPIASAPASVPLAPSAQREHQLAAEVNLLDRARATLRAGAPDECLAMLEDYEARFPDGKLRAEARAVRAEALAKRDGEKPTPKP